MKRRKDRLHRVMIIGANPAGVAATNKLGEMGIPVTLVDREPNLDEKLSREEFRLSNGVALNYAHRSGLIRLLRNPAIRCILPAEVVSLKHTPQGFRARVKIQETYIDPIRCTLCGRCVEICPVITPNGQKPIQIHDRRSLPGRAIIDKRKAPLCQSDCPLGVNVQAYVALARAGRFQEALDIVRKDNILPGICGRVCTHPCEQACRRGELDEPVAIRSIKRFLADYERSQSPEFRKPIIPRRKEQIAIVGSGPAGLACAADLVRYGYEVTIFEKQAQSGGMLRYGIGPYRLPREILDDELEYIQALGIRFVNSYPVDLPAGLEKLKERFDRVVLAVGCWTDRRLGVEGEELEGVEGCLSLLNRLYGEELKSLDERIAVIGDGNAAFDLGRSLRRIGADVTILSWFPEDLIPADSEEVRGAREEQISIKDRTQVIGFSARNGKLDQLVCKPTEPGKPDVNGIPWPVIVPGSRSFKMSFDRAIVAIGQRGPFPDHNGSNGMKISSEGLVAVDRSYATSMKGVYAAGDAVTGASSVVEAMAVGRKVARSVHRDLCDEDMSMGISLRPKEKDYPEIPPDIPSLARPTMPERQAGARSNNFSEVALGLSEAQVRTEAERCLQCGVCSECMLCYDVCGSIGAVNHLEVSDTRIEHAGVTIIADPEAAPMVRGEDVIRAYGPKAAKADVNAMITRGFSAAAEAMILLGETAQRPRGHGVSFSLPGPDLSPEIRVGLFICRCNDSFGWSDRMDEQVARFSEYEDVVYTEVLMSACDPEGSGSIVRSIRAKGITRVVLASCVCCPLDFICSACTDQRSRLKEAIFSGTGVSRSMVETCNLRGEVLRYLRDDLAAAVYHFSGLIERSIQRARRLKPLPTPARTYNFTTAVIGDSQAVMNSARTLAEAGLEVLMFESSDKALLEELNHPNIHWFEDSVVRGVSGTLGDFQIFVESETFSQVLQVGAVILGEKHRRKIPYIPQKGLPNRIIQASMQKKGVPGIPFHYPGATSIAGLFLADPPGIHVSERKKGAAAAVLAAAVMPRGPRQSKGFTVVVDKDRCRGCGSCFQACPYQAITFHKNEVGGWYAVVDEALCKGCGNCISVCPSNAADSPYRNHVYLERLLEEVLIQ